MKMQILVVACLVCVCRSCCCSAAPLTEIALEGILVEWISRKKSALSVGIFLVDGLVLFIQ